jgi:hypothetical protein
MTLTLASLHVYPVKGLKGIDLREATATERGLEHDRRWMVVDSQGEFLTQREHPKMATIWTGMVEGALELSAPEMPPVDVPLESDAAPSMRVRVWNSVVDAAPVSGFADAWLSEYLGMPCRLVYMPAESRRESNARYGGTGNLVGFADGYAYLVTNSGSLAELNKLLAIRGQAAVLVNLVPRNLDVPDADGFSNDGLLDPPQV